MCKVGGLLITYLYDEHKALVTDADCDCWRCPECAKKLAAKWSLRAEIGARKLVNEGATLDFITLTSHEKNRTFEASAAVWADAWHKLHHRLNKRAEVREYLMIPERHKSGALHLHALWTFGVSRRWLKDNARACGLGYQADVKHVTEARFAVRYVTKYVAKSLGENTPAHFRRVRVSANWADIPVPTNEASMYEWHHIGGNGALQSAYEECARAKLQMIDVRTGEVFEDIDLGTIVATNYA
jgi:hypothetical protein